MSMYKSQHGIAIISVLLIVVLMSSIVAFMAEKQFLQIKRMSYFVERENMHFLLMGAESMALAYFTKNKNPKSQFFDIALFKVEDDTYTIQYANNEDVFSPVIILKKKLAQVEGSIKIRDAQARFNLNNLLVEDAVLKSQQKNILSNLLQSAGVEDDFQRQALVNNIVDWVDENNLMTENGKENDYYENLEKPYRAANQAMAIKGELMQIDGIDIALLQRIAPYICLLPEKNSKININTASGQVLAALSLGPNVSLDIVHSLLSAREQPQFTGFQVEKVVDTLISASPIKSNVVQTMLSDKSNYFLIEIELNVNNRRYAMYSLVQRTVDSDNKVKYLIIRREPVFL